jgi:hypothetical protein
MEKNLKIKLKASDGKKYTLEVEVPVGSDTAEFLREIQESNHLVGNSFEWLYDGWEVNSIISVTPLMIAAAIEKEAHSYQQDAINKLMSLQERRWAQDFALLLLGFAVRICELEAQRLRAISVPVLT